MTLRSSALQIARVAGRVLLRLRDSGSHRYHTPDALIDFLKTL